MLEENVRKYCEVQDNKKRFIELVNSISINFDKEKLINFLEVCDFFTSPLTTKYKGAYEGGLCEHSLNVYGRLCSLVKETPLQVDNDTLIICGLLSNVWKANYYYTRMRNVMDETGKYHKVQEFAIKEPKDRFIFGNTSFTNLMIVSKFIPLSEQQSIVLMNQDCGMNDGYSNKDIYAVMSDYPLTTLVHSANLICMYCEGIDNE